jgi:hypothetical protein
MAKFGMMPYRSLKPKREKEDTKTPSSTKPKQGRKKKLPLNQ